MPLARVLSRPKTAARNVWFSSKIRRESFVKTGMNTLSSNSCDVVYNLLKLLQCYLIAIIMERKMSLKSKILIPVSAGFLLAAGIASSSFAYPNAYSGASHSYSGYTNNNVAADNRFRGTADSGSSNHRPNRIILDGSSTASHYYSCLLYTSPSPRD